jgi:putative ABC transport system permease protein
LDVHIYSKAKVKITSDQVMESVRTAIIDQGFMVSALSDLIEQANQVFKIIQIILASFGIVALIVSAIGMFNTMTIALLERTQEIGVMKALGATGVDIWNMFLAESVIIGFFGGLGGIIIGMLTGEIFNHGVNFLAGALGGDKIDIFYTPYWFIILIISFSTFVGFLTGFYPAQRAAKISPLVALRYK